MAKGILTNCQYGKFHRRVAKILRKMNNSYGSPEYHDFEFVMYALGVVSLSHTSPECHMKTWMTIDLSKTKGAISSGKEGAPGYWISDWASEFKLERIKKEKGLVNLAMITVAQLDFESGATVFDTLMRAGERGLKFCQKSVILPLAAAYQPEKGERILIGTIPQVDKSDDDLLLPTLQNDYKGKIFTNDSDGLWISVCEGNSDYFLPPETALIFELPPKKEKQ